MQEYEVAFEKWNILTERHEIKYDFFECVSAEAAKRAAYWVHGDLIDIVKVTPGE